MSDAKDKSASPSIQAFAEVNWAEYTQYRPAYPQSLLDLILAHHRTSSTSFSLAHDIGSGSGIFAAELSRYFNHVHVSDPSASSVEQARQNLSALYHKSASTAGAERDQKCATFTFSCCKGEDAQLATASSSVDMVTVATAAHFMDVDLLMSAVADSLKPGGTLAIVFYGRSRIANSARAEEVYTRVYSNIGERLAKQVQLSDEALKAQWERGMANASMGLEFVPLDARVWDMSRSKRVKINSLHGERSFAGFHESWLDTKSRAGPGEERAFYEYGDEEAAGWRKIVDKKWFRGHVGSYSQGDPGYLLDMPVFKELEKVLEEEFPDDGIVVEWTVNVVLTTKI
jgi:SAM-dependent methyltransferase